MEKHNIPLHRALGCIFWNLRNNYNASNFDFEVDNDLDVFKIDVGYEIDGKKGTFKFQEKWRNLPDKVGLSFELLVRKLLRKHFKTVNSESKE